MISIPCAIISNGKILRLVEAAEPFIGPNGVQHPMGVWQCWTPADFSALCPGWSVVPVIDVTPEVEDTQTFAKNDPSKWTLGKDKVTVTYTVMSKPALQISQEKAADAAARKKAVVEAVQHHMDVKAHERNYDSILSACTYATSTIEKFRVEGQACVEWRDAVWTKCYELLAQVEAGEIEPLTPDQVVAQLPAFTWPV